MTDVIHRLPENLVSKIAAGEVIERPASVVKELVENALDASATRISIEVSNGGQHGIRVSDDGVGMSREDAAVCVERHATSKLHSPSDLFGITTLGFRGEALASIGAVSRMDIETCRSGDAEGSTVSVEGGVRRDVSPAARAPGTTIEVRNLFFNTPARRKFLRQVDTESRYITQVIVQLAVAFPGIGFRLVNQEREVLNLVSADRRERTAEVFGLKEDELLHGLREEEGVQIETLVSLPEACRRRRGKQFAIVRERPIVNKGLSRAVYDGYGGLLSHGTHPQFAVFLDVDPAKVDVNVHPTKREVRFSEERRVVGVVKSTVRSSLDMPETTSFTTAGDGGRSFGNATFSETPSSYESSSSTFDADPGRLSRVSHIDLTAGEGQMSLSLVPPTMPTGSRLVGEGSESAAAMDEIAAATAMWQVHNKYIITTVKDGIAVIDQHVAHERIRYEEVLNVIGQESAATQQLLLPLTLELNPVEMDSYREAHQLFESIGFGVREFGPHSVIVDSLPVDLRNWDDGNVFRQIVADLLEELEARSEATEALAASVACHTSIRAGEWLSAEEMNTLVKRLLKTKEPFVCPHGRPIIIRIPLNELDRLFGRI